MSEASLSSHDELIEQPLLPVRRLHNFVYCPRLCYFQWVENQFVENEDTVAGDSVHRNIDKPTGLKEKKKDIFSESLREGERLKSLHLTSEKLRLTGVVDLVEQTESGARIIDYKRGSARINEQQERVAKGYDSVQVAAHALLLQERGIEVHSASIYYAADKRHVTVKLDDALFAKTKQAIADAQLLSLKANLPKPLINDIRCNYCSAYSICLPNETHWWKRADEDIEKPQLPLGIPGILGESETDWETRDETQLPPRPEGQDGEILVVQTYGTQVGVRGGEFVVTQKREVLRKLPINQVRAIYLYGAVQVTAQAVQSCLDLNIDVGYFSGAGRFLGSLRGLPTSGIDARKGQYWLFEEPFFRLKLARECIRAKVHNQRVMLMRNGYPSKVTVNRLAAAVRTVIDAVDLPEIRGIEGSAAATYFSEFNGMLKCEGEVSFDFKKRTKRPPMDPVNALLSLGYSVLAKEVTGVCHMVGLDPFYGFFHQPRYGRPALALDLMEEFRPLIADSVAISLINRGEVDESDFYFSTKGVGLNDRGRRKFWEAWFRRLDTEIKHPIFHYKMSYRRMLEVQARQMWRFLRGEVSKYHAFTTR